jgi:hypothetical protein
VQSRFVPRVASLVTLAACLLALVLVFWPRPALAQNKAVEAQARALDKKAMDDDYLATEFDKATDKINQAIAKCGTDKCGAALRAQLKRDLGVIQVAAGKKDAATASFAEAIKIDPNVQLDPDLKTKEVETAWDDAKGRRGGGGGGAAASSGGGEPSGDFTHTSVGEQTIRTPVPVYVEYGGSESLAKVVVKYKGFGMTEWKQLELKPLGKGFGAEIPCLDVLQGELQYYVQGFNAQNDPVATGGDRNNSYRVTIKRDKIVGDAPHLPGREPSRQCADTGDCPPDFPGCKKGGAADDTLKSEGADCEEDSECKSGVCTKSKTCAAEDEPKVTKRAKVWIGVAGAWDLVILPSGDDVCLLNASALPANAAGYYCTNSDGTDYPTRADKSQNDLIVLGKSDKVSGGLAPGNVRVMLTVDVAVTSNILIGARLGYVLNRYPGVSAGNEGKTFAPVHAEGRLTYVFGKDALAKAGMAGYVYAAGGVAEFDAQVPVTVVEKGVNGGKSVQAWNIGGPGFVSVGGGIRYAFTPRFALQVGPRLNVALGGTSTLLTISPELGAAVGF